MKILSIDGGGIRGIFSLEVLRMLEEESGFLSSIDCFAGTSTGGIIAAALSLGKSPKEVLELYMELGPHIFKPNSGKGPHYSIDALKQGLESVIPKELTFSDLPKHLIIPAFDLSTWEPVSFDTFSKKGTVVDALAATSALPIFFAPYENLVDGGVFAPNPALLAASKVADPRVLSIGTGHPKRVIPEGFNWGSEHWSGVGTNRHPLIALFTEANIKQTEKMCEELLGDAYCRMTCNLETTVRIDDPSQVAVLLESAAKLKESPKWSECLRWLAVQDEMTQVG